MKAGHLVIYKRRRGNKYVLRCFDCAFAGVAPSYEVAMAAIRAHVSAPDIPV